jgi:UTP--glucose-1-phosphate uridylyltransferase
VDSGEQVSVKAVIVAAGYGSRLLPVTRAVPKELLPLVDRPAIDFVLDELEAAGIREVLVITSRRKHTLEDWFDRDPELESVLTGDKLQRARPRDLDVHFIRQSHMGGTGDALRLAAVFAGSDPVVVCYPDDLFDPPTATKQLGAAGRATGGCAISCVDLHGQDVSRYGVLDVDESLQVRAWVEKPAPGSEPSTLVVLGRYLVTPAFFEALERRYAEHGDGEFYPVGAIGDMAAAGQVVACPIDSARRDTGAPLGYVQAFIDEALRRPELAAELVPWLRGRLGESERQ